MCPIEFLEPWTGKKIEFKYISHMDHSDRILTLVAALYDSSSGIEIQSQK